MEEIEAVCWEDGCINDAVGERFESFSSETFNVDDDGEQIAEVVVLVCYEHAVAPL